MILNTLPVGSNFYKKVILLIIKPLQLAGSHRSVPKPSCNLQEAVGAFRNRAATCRKHFIYIQHLNFVTIYS